MRFAAATVAEGRTCSAADDPLRQHRGGGSGALRRAVASVRRAHASDISRAPLHMTTRPSPSRVWAPDETAADLFARLDALPLAVLPCCRGLHVGEALELFGEPGTGKSALLGEAALRCILPEAVDGVPVGGHASDAVLVDVDGTFDVLWLSEALQARALAVCGDAARAAAIAEECMRRLMLRCASGTSCCSASTRSAACSPSAAAATAATTRRRRRPPPRPPNRPRRRRRRGSRRAPRARPPPHRQPLRLPVARARAPRPSAAAAARRAAASTRRWRCCCARCWQHRLCVVWSRTPASTRNGGADFPLDMGAAAGAAPAWAAAAAHRRPQAPRRRRGCRRELPRAPHTGGAARRPAARVLRRAADGRG